MEIENEIYDFIFDYYIFHVDSREKFLRGFRIYYTCSQIFPLLLYGRIMFLL